MNPKVVGVVVIVIFIFSFWPSSVEITSCRLKIFSVPKNGLNNSSITERSYYTRNKTITPPAVLIRLKGGIGNQLFQYACHYALARKNNWPLYIILPRNYSKASEDKRKWGLRHREFVIDQFHIPLGEWNAVDETLWNITGEASISDTQMLGADYPKDKVIYNNDYCQSEAFFSTYREELLEYFVQNVDLKDVKELIKVVEEFESVAVHIRRGDFVRLNASVPLSFHRKCMYNIVKRLEGKSVAFFLFSDDIDYVQRNLFKDEDTLPKEFPIYIVTDKNKTNSLQELYLMSKCKHQIIADSTFSWWGAYLNRNRDKIVYAANYRISTVESIYGARKDFFVWLYKYMYYPVGWERIEPDWES